MKKANFDWPSDWPSVEDGRARLLLIGLCMRSDENGEITVSRRMLASFAVCSRPSIDPVIETLKLADCLAVTKPGRDEMGSYGPNSYMLRLDNSKVKGMFDDLRRRRQCANCMLEIGSRPGKTVRWREDLPEQDFGRPCQEVLPRPYIDSRASSSSSSPNSCFLSALPETFGVDDPRLRSQIKLAWKVLGEGVDVDRVPELVRSLAKEIPKALDDGYDFDEDVLRCLRDITRNRRDEPLWSFKVVFERDLPVFRRKRMRRLGKGA